MTRFDELSARFAGGNPPDLKAGSGAGATANTNIPITGITTDDIIVFALSFQAPTAASGDAFTDITATTTITSDGNVQSTTVTTAQRVLVLFWDLAS